MALKYASRSHDAVDGTARVRLLGDPGAVEVGAAIFVVPRRVVGGGTFNVPVLCLADDELLFPPQRVVAKLAAPKRDRGDGYC